MSQKRSSGTLYLIPSFLSEKAVDTIPASVLNVIHRTFHFFVENERTARRFLRALDKDISIDDRHFYVVNHHKEPDLVSLKKSLFDGNNVGIISEAGYPCIADPGHLLVKKAHEWKIRVVPLSGPNSMLMALSASGFNGQQFRFSGYLSREKDKRKTELLNLEKLVQKTGESQIFMEAPYRNEQVLKDMVQFLKKETKVCIAADLTAEEEFIKTQSIQNWEKDFPSLHKRPVIFIIGR